MKHVLIIAVTISLLSSTPVWAQQPPAKAKEAQKRMDELRAKLVNIGSELVRLGEKANPNENDLQRIKTLAGEREETITALIVLLKDAPGPMTREENHLITRILEQPIETKGLQEKLKLKTVLEHFTNQFVGRLPILVDREAFLATLGADAPDPFEEEVFLPQAPSQMRTGTALRLVLSQVGKGRATFVIRQGFIEITPRQNTTAEFMLGQSINTVSFDQRPLKDVLQELTDQTGLEIHLDPNVGKKADTAIKATFRNSSLEDAIVTVTEMADLKYVALERSVFVTTPERATALRKEEMERATQRELLRMQKLNGGS